jgi:hypothetical protein
MRRMMWVILVAFLTACAQVFTPAEAPLRDGAIPAFSTARTVAISNAQSSSDPVIVYSQFGTTITSDLKAITEVMVQQAQKELQKNGRPTEAAGSKSIALKVKSLRSAPVIGAFHSRSQMEFQVTLGSGQPIDFRVVYGTGAPLADTALNGGIAEGVMTLFKDERVKAYLAN